MKKTQIAFTAERLSSCDTNSARQLNFYIDMFNQLLGHFSAVMIDRECENEFLTRKAAVTRIPLFFSSKKLFINMTRILLTQPGWKNMPPTNKNGYNFYYTMLVLNRFFSFNISNFSCDCLF